VTASPACPGQIEAAERNKAQKQRSAGRAAFFKSHERLQRMKKPRLRLRAAVSERNPQVRNFVIASKAKQSIDKSLIYVVDRHGG
jgi:hypothetical protein